MNKLALVPKVISRSCRNRLSCKKGLHSRLFVPIRVNRIGG